MNKYRFCSSLSLFALTVAFALAPSGCGRGGSLLSTPSAPHAALASLSSEVTLVATSGDVEVRGESGPYARMEVGRPTRRATSIRVRGGGATFRIGTEETPRGALWLREGATIEIGEDESGALAVVADEGEARVRVRDGRVRVFAKNGSSSPDSNDVLVWRGDDGRDDGQRAASTADHLAEAEWSFAFDAKKEPAGIGTLETRSDSGAVTRLRIARMDVSAHTLGDYAETEVSEVFVNDGDARTEGTFRYPLPEGAFLVGLAMEINGKLMEGEIVPREKGEKIYESIVDAMRDPALLEWESGSVFKLRVFPLEPHAEKRVVIRFAAPLRPAPLHLTHGATASGGLEFAYRTSASCGPLAPFSFKMSVDDRVVLDETSFTPGRDVVANVASRGGVFRERRDDGVYLAAHVVPDWSKIPAPKAPARRDVVVVVDTSRSTLEERRLLLDSLRLVLSELRASDRFLVVAADVDTRDQAKDFVASSPSSVDGAVHFVEAIEPDGASDLGAALRHVTPLLARSRAAGASPEVIYLGDGAATWGETDATALSHVADTALGDAPLHAMLLGAGSDVAGMRRVVAARGGRLGAPRTELEARRLAVGIAHAFELRHIDHTRLSGGEHAAIFPDVETTIFEGDDVPALLRIPKGEAEPTSLDLVGTVAGKEHEERVAFGASPVDAPRVAQRWAREKLASIEAEGASKKDDAVKLSLAFGILGRDTSLLVLESEEQYAQFDIERKAKKRAADAAPTVSGADLESVSGQARLDPDHIQPGDPEVRIFAPADARAVVVTLPSGETKVAEFEPELGAWTIRFLIDKDTPDGTYDVHVRVVHADGRIETQLLHYVVDTQKPKVNVRVHRGVRPGSYEILATQEISEDEVAHAVPRSSRGATLTEDRARFAQILTDAQHVEVALPDGQTLDLVAIRLGEFRGTWTPHTAPHGPLHVRVVTTDRAINQDVRELDLALP